MIYCGVGGPRWRLTRVNESEPFIYIGSHGTKTQSLRVFVSIFNMSKADFKLYTSF